MALITPLILLLRVISAISIVICRDGAAARRVTARATRQQQLCAARAEGTSYRVL